MLVNGMLVNGEPGNVISIRDRGLLYGDGVFRTILARHGKAFQWIQHYKKLQHDCDKLGITCPDEPLLAEQLHILLRLEPDGVVKLIITRGEGTRGYAPPNTIETSVIWDVSPLPDYPADWETNGVTVKICQNRLSLQPRLAGIKHLNRLENVLAAAELKETGADTENYAEGMMMDMQNNVIEGTRSNLFLVFQDKLVTPDLSRCGVAGIQREKVMVWAVQQNMQVEIRDIKLDEAMNADELFLTNSIFGLWPIKKWEQRNWFDFPVSKRIRKSLGDAGIWPATKSA